MLQAPVARPEDDFFAAGGDSLKAIKLVAGLERALGLTLSLTLVNEAPRFAELCAALRQHHARHRTALVLLKPGAGAAPLFFVHGVGGNVAELFALARSMSYPGPVFGIQARGLAPRERRHTTVEAMAAEYLRAIRARQCEGPYHLCGYSFGGLVAFEMARRLKASGEAVGLVGLIDAMPGPLHWPLPRWVTYLGRRALRWATRILAASLTPSRPPCGAALRRPGQAPALIAFLKSSPARVVWVAACGLLARARYSPGFYPGEVKLFIPLERDPALPDPGTLWRRHAAALSVVCLPGGHLTMLSRPHASYAAASLTWQLQHCNRGSAAAESAPGLIKEPDAWHRGPVAALADSSQPALLPGEAIGLDAVGGVQLADRVREIVAHRTQGQVELRGDVS